MKNLWLERKKKQGINAKFLNEAKELESRWAKLGLLDGMNRRFERAVTAELMCCQRLLNELPPQQATP